MSAIWGTLERTQVRDWQSPWEAVRQSRPKMKSVTSGDDRRNGWKNEKSKNLSKGENLNNVGNS